MNEEIQSAGGTARAAALSPERRSEIARDAARTRWHREPANKPVDDGVREQHGCAALEQGTVRIWEREDSVAVRVWDPSPTIAQSAERRLCPAQARYLADRLYHLARRIEERRP